MKLLLDTHALIWALARSSRLPDRVAVLLRDRSNEIWVSAVSGYEIEFKRPRSPEIASLPSDIEGAASDIGFQWLSVQAKHAIGAGQLPTLHRDPFDRLLIAQAFTESASLVTRDPWIAPYGVPTLW